MSSPYGVSIVGVGHHLPATPQSNEELCEHLDVTPEWIVEKTGIRQRFIAAPDDSASDYSIEAARKALAHAGVSPEDVDLIIVCTFSGDYLYPPVSAKVQHVLQAKNAQIFDLQANCTGFVTGLTVATDRMRVDPTVRHALVIGTEFMSRFIDPADVNTSDYHSDGSGAALLSQTAPDTGILASAFHTDGNNFEAVRMRGGGSSHPLHNREFDPAIDFMEMNGLATWRQAITHLPRTMTDAIKKAGLGVADIDFFVFHQANLRLIEYLMGKMRVKMSKTFTNVQEIGNTGAASVGIALSEAVQKELIAPGALVLMAGVGAGFNFGANVWRWPAALSGQDS